MSDRLRCPRCAEVVEKYRNPSPTVDIIETDLAFDHGRILQDYFQRSRTMEGCSA
jgi:hypothetical protein